MVKILNLAGNIKDIVYKVNKYPDGQQDLVIQDTHILREEEIPVRINTRLTNFEDLNLLICAVKSLQNARVKRIQLFISYLLGARSDRMFQDGGVSYLRDVIAPILNSLKVEKITVLDPHNPDVLSALIPNLEVSRLEDNLLGLRSDIVLVSPDAGANKKIHSIADNVKFTGRIITCSKHRKGDRVITVVPGFDLSKDIVIIDDIHDYGTTFRNIAQTMIDMGHKGNRYLHVTHSIQDEGLQLTCDLFTKVYTTNSYKEFKGNDKLIINKVI